MLHERDLLPLLNGFDRGLSSLFHFSLPSIRLIASAPTCLHPDLLYTKILVVPRDDVDFEAALSSIRSCVESKYGLGLSVTSPLDNYNLEGVDSVMVALAAFGSVALMIAAINALNLMIARALRRIKSFGISAALGLSRRGIFI